MLVDQHGRPLASSITEGSEEATINRSWVLATGIGSPNIAAPSAYKGFSRRDHQIKARLAFYFNFAISGAVETVQSFVIGEQFNWGDVADKTARMVIDEFHAANDLTVLVERFAYEYMLDGENATIFPLESEGLTPDAPAIVNFVDVVQGVNLEYTQPHRPLEASFGGIKGTFDASRFTWSAHRALYNDARGMPVIQTAVDPALALAGLLDSRLRAHELNSRLNAIYTALVDSSNTQVDMGKQLAAKSSAFTRVPKNGSVLTLAKDIITGQEEKFEFLQGARGSSDAEKDAMLFMLAVSITLGIPLHWVWNGDTANRASSDSMTEPAKRRLSKFQSVVRRWLDNLMRLELTRRLGPDATLMVYKNDISDDGRTIKKRGKRVPIGQYTYPWSFPTLDMRGLTEQINRSQFALDNGIASLQTTAADLGYDFALEQELLLAAPPKSGARAPRPSPAAPSEV